MFHYLNFNEKHQELIHEMIGMHHENHTNQIDRKKDIGKIIIFPKRKQDDFPYTTTNRLGSKKVLKGIPINKYKIKHFTPIKRTLITNMQNSNLDKSANFPKDERGDNVLFSKSTERLPKNNFLNLTFNNFGKINFIVKSQINDKSHNSKKVIVYDNNLNAINDIQLENEENKTKLNNTDFLNLKRNSRNINLFDESNTLNEDAIPRIKKYEILENESKVWKNKSSEKILRNNIQKNLNNNLVENLNIILQKNNNTGTNKEDINEDDDNDDVQTIVENDCENDYSFIFNCLNEYKRKK